MTEAEGDQRSRRTRTVALGVGIGVLVLLAIGGGVLATRADDPAGSTAGAGPGSATSRPSGPYLAAVPEVTSFVDALAAVQPGKAADCRAIAEQFAGEFASLPKFLAAVGTVDDPELQTLLSDTQMSVADTLAACGRNDAVAFDAGAAQVAAGREQITAALARLEQR